MHFTEVGDNLIWNGLVHPVELQFAGTDIEFVDLPVINGMYAITKTCFADTAQRMSRATTSSVPYVATAPYEGISTFKALACRSVTQVQRCKFDCNISLTSQQMRIHVSGHILLGHILPSEVLGPQCGYCGSTACQPPVWRKSCSRTNREHVVFHTCTCDYVQVFRSTPSSKNSPTSDYPLTCPVSTCKQTIWKYSMKQHLLIHPDYKLATDQYDVSDQERAAVLALFHKQTGCENQITQESETSVNASPDKGSQDSEVELAQKLGSAEGSLDQDKESNADPTESDSDSDGDSDDSDSGLGYLLVRHVLV